MPNRRPTHNDLQFIAKLESSRLKDLRSGAGLERRTGHSIDQLIAKATRGRMALARAFYRQARVALRSTPPANRLAVNRGYYACYHYFRAVVFFVHGGDEFEKHSELPSHIPHDFPNRGTWENALKSARLDRNRVDYDPFPADEASYRAAARRIVGDFRSLQPIVKAYLSSKGLSL